MAPLQPLAVSHDLGSVPARARIQMTAASGVKMTSRCATADTQPKAETHCGDSPARPQAKQAGHGEHDGRNRRGQERQPQSSPAERDPPCVHAPRRGVHDSRPGRSPGYDQGLGNHAPGQRHQHQAPARAPSGISRLSTAKSGQGTALTVLPLRGGAGNSATRPCSPRASAANSLGRDTRPPFSSEGRCASGRRANLY